jgi:predicted transcriptional regulator
MEQSRTNIRAILKSPYTSSILSGIDNGYRPSQIAEQLGISPQLINYYTDNLIFLKLIEKIGDKRGLFGDLTQEEYSF